MPTRASHYRAEARHSQRGGTPKAKLQPVGSDTLWLSSWLEEVQGAGPFGADSILALPLGATSRDRELKLRAAASLGVLRMSAKRVAGVFIKYVWELTPAGTLATPASARLRAEGPTPTLVVGPACGPASAPKEPGSVGKTA